MQMQEVIEKLKDILAREVDIIKAYKILFKTINNILDPNNLILISFYIKNQYLIWRLNNQKFFLQDNTPLQYLHPYSDIQLHIF